MHLSGTWPVGFRYQGEQCKPLLTRGKAGELIQPATIPPTGRAAMPLIDVVRVCDELVCRFAAISSVDLNLSGTVNLRQAAHRVARLSVLAMSIFFQPDVSHLETAAHPCAHQLPAAVGSATCALQSLRIQPTGSPSRCSRVQNASAVVSGTLGGLCLIASGKLDVQSAPGRRQPSLRLV